MELHLVGGFLGSGKTTSIIDAAKMLMAQGKLVGVVTNDKGKHLVDTAFFRSSAIPTAEVAGGCFRCNYDTLEHQLDGLIERHHPDVIFAESVGSCADMAATVLQPLLTYLENTERHTSFSVFCDVRLLRLWLMGEELPFSDEVVYIFEQQLLEASILVLNKIDLLSAAQLDTLLEAAHARFPEKQLVAQSALQPNGTAAWLELIASADFILPEAVSTIDYERYDQGGSALAWLDEQIIIEGARTSEAVALLVEAIYTSLRNNQIAIGHVKFFFDDGEHASKLSFPTLENEHWCAELPKELSGSVSVVVNGRVECAPAKLNRIVTAALSAMKDAVDVTYQRAASAYFRPRVFREKNSYVDELTADFTVMDDEA